MAAFYDALVHRHGGYSKLQEHRKRGLQMTEPEDPFVGTDGFGEGLTETTYAQDRLPNHIYASRSFTIDRPTSSDYGQPARFIHKVFDSETETTLTLDGNEWLIDESPRGRIQVKLLVAREAGRVKELWIQKVPANGSRGTIKVALNLKAPQVQRLVDLLKASTRSQ